MDVKPLAYPSPWVLDTIGDAGEVLEPRADVTVRCDGHEGLKGDTFVVRWGAVGGVLPLYRSEPKELPRNHYPLDFFIPIAEVIAREGQVEVDYEVTTSFGMVYSDSRHLLVISTPRLLPIDVIEATDDVIDLTKLNVGATMSVPHQPGTVPAGSVITFEWEGIDGQQQPVRGTAKGYDNGSQPTQCTLPIADLERVAEIAIRYRVDTATSVHHFATPLASYDSEWRKFRISGASEAWPAPEIIELTGDTLVPPAVRNGATCLIDAELVASDRVSVTFGNYFAETIPGSRPLRIIIPPGEIGIRLNESVIVGYTIERNGVRSHSSPLPIHILGFAPNDPQLPQPRVDVADGDDVDLSRFSGNPHIVVDPWILMDRRQTVWLTLRGEYRDGTPAEISLLNGATVESRWIDTGIEIAVERSDLEALRDRSALKITCYVNFRGGGIEGATTLRARTYTLRTGSIQGGRAWEAEDFNDLVALIRQRDVQLRFMTLRQIKGNLYTAPGEAPPYVDGLFSPHWIEAGAHSELTLNQPAPQVRIGLSPNGPGLPIHIAAFDESAQRVAFLTRDTPGWAQLKDTEGQRWISRIELWTTGDGIAWFDNVLVDTGEPWSMEREPVFETFDDIAPGRYGPRLDITGWSIVADRADIEIENAPGGMVGQALAVHMIPEGHVHHFTPRFGVRPTQSVQLKVRSSRVDPHTAHVHVANFNQDDHNLRTVSRRISIHAATQLVTFDTPQDLPRQNELLSHLRIVHENGNHEVTAFYDDLSIV